MPITFSLLALSICFAWPYRSALLQFRGLSIPPWVLLYGGSVVSAVLQGYVEWPGLIALAALGGLTWGSTRSIGRWAQATLMSATLLLSLALFLHAVPGFANPLLVSEVQLSPKSAPMSQYLNFDKASAGLFLFAAYSQRLRSPGDLRRALPAMSIAATLTTVSVIGVGLIAGYIAYDPKIPSFAISWLVTNLFFTCVAEEALFRGLLQERMSRWFSNSALAYWLPLIVTSLLFGLAHAPGGLALVALATCVGVGSAWAYASSRRIEAAVLTHFTVNAVHFLAFTYPQLAR